MSAGIQSLPAEVLLNVARYLTIPTIRSLKLSSHYFDEVLSSNEWTVYHNAALNHAYVDDERVSVSEAKTQNSRYPVEHAECATWGEYCRQCFLLDAKWAGISQISERNDKTKGYCIESRDVHHFKVDEQRGLLFTSDRGEESRSAITVTDLKTGRLIWQTEPDYAPPKTHLEYDNGYLVFDARTDAREKEVWRLAHEMVDGTQSTTPPDPFQIRASQYAEAYYGRNGLGVLRPWAFLRTPQVTHVFRLVYPTLVAASNNTAYLWDIATGILEQTLPDLQMAQTGTESLGEIQCVDVNEHNVVLCGENEVHVIARAGGALVFRMPGKTGYAKTILFPKTPERRRPRQEIDSHLTKRLHVATVCSSGEYPWLQFRAAQLSACGRDLACLLKDGRVVLVRDYESVAEQHTPIEDAALEIFLTHSRSQDKRFGYSLDFAHDRVAVATSAGLFIMTLDACTRRLLDREPPPPISTGKGKARETEPPTQNAADVIVVYSPRLSNWELMADVSWVQMSATHLYLVYKASRMELKRDRGMRVDYFRVRGERGTPSETALYLYDAEPLIMEEIHFEGWRERTLEYRRAPSKPGNSICCIDFSA